MENVPLDEQDISIVLEFEHATCPYALDLSKARSKIQKRHPLRETSRKHCFLIVMGLDMRLDRLQDILRFVICWPIAPGLIF